VLPVMGAGVSVPPASLAAYLCYNCSASGGCVPGPTPLRAIKGLGGLGLGVEVT
jgi:hypothetical protein